MLRKSRQETHKNTAMYIKLTAYCCATATNFLLILESRRKANQRTKNGNVRSNLTIPFDFACFREESSCTVYYHLNDKSNNRINLACFDFMKCYTIILDWLRSLRDLIHSIVHKANSS